MRHLKLVFAKDRPTFLPKQVPSYCCEMCAFSLFRWFPFCMLLKILKKVHTLFQKLVWSGVLQLFCVIKTSGRTSVSDKFADGGGLLSFLAGICRVYSSLVRSFEWSKLFIVFVLWRQKIFFEFCLNYGVLIQTVIITRRPLYAIPAPSPEVRPSRICLSERHPKKLHIIKLPFTATPSWVPLGTKRIVW